MLNSAMLMINNSDEFIGNLVKRLILTFCFIPSISHSQNIFVFQIIISGMYKNYLCNIWAPDTKLYFATRFSLSFK